MIVPSATARALAEIASRAADVMRVYTPGAVSLHNDTGRQATKRYTSDQLTVAAPVNAYFITRDERGLQMYTRDGEFRFHDAILVDRFNEPVMGLEPGGSLAPLRANSIDVSLGRIKDLHIEADGSLAYARALIDPRTGESRKTRTVIGRLALGRFPVASQLQFADATRARAPQGVAPHIGLPGDGNFEPVFTHQRESSRLNIDDAIEKLREAYAAFDALRSAQTAQGKLEKAAMDLVK